MGKNWYEDTLKGNIGSFHDMATEILAYCENDIKTTNTYFKYVNVDLKNTSIKKVIFNDPATIVIWSDNTKTVVKCSKDDKFDPEKGLAMAISKRVYGDNFKKVFKEWVPEEVDITNIGMSLSEFATNINKIFIPMSTLQKINK